MSLLRLPLVAFVFDFINGFHDSANSIATIAGTRVLSPFAAVSWAAVFNFAAAFTIGTAVAKTVGAGMIDVSIVTPKVVLGGLLGAITWNLITWYWGIPSSSSHTLLGGYAGAATAKAGFGAIIVSGWAKTLVFIFVSPLVGVLLGSAILTAVYWIFRYASPRRVDRFCRLAQLAAIVLCPAAVQWQAAPGYVAQPVGGAAAAASGLTTPILDALSGAIIALAYFPPVAAAFGARRDQSQTTRLASWG